MCSANRDWEVAWTLEEKSGRPVGGGVEREKS